MCTETIKNYPPPTDCERNHNLRILSKKLSIFSRQFFGYATEDKKDTYIQEKSNNKYHHVVFTDRNTVPHMEQITGTQKHHSVAGDWYSKRR